MQKHSGMRAWLAVLCGALLPSLHGYAADSTSAFSARPVRWIVPFPPAGRVDLVGRVVAQKLYEAWGQQIVIDNRAGGGGRRDPVPHASQIPL